MTEISTVIASTLKLAPEHASKLLSTRNPGPKAVGSVFDTPQTWESLQAADWQPYEHPAIGGPAAGFRAPVSGKVGLVELATLDPSTPVTMVDGHETGFVSPVVEGLDRQPVAFSVMLVGPADKDDPTLIVWTVFPGDPVRPSSLRVEETPSGTTLTAAEAIALGFDLAKVGS